METKIEIPEDIQEICRKIAKTAAECKLHSFKATFSPKSSPTGFADIHMHWEAGRHNEDHNRLFITSECRVHTTINDSKEVAR